MRRTHAANGSRSRIWEPMWACRPSRSILGESARAPARARPGRPGCRTWSPRGQWPSTRAVGARTPGLMRTSASCGAIARAARCRSMSSKESITIRPDPGGDRRLDVVVATSRCRAAGSAPPACRRRARSPARRPRPRRSTCPARRARRSPPSTGRPWRRSGRRWRHGASAPTERNSWALAAQGREVHQQRGSLELRRQVRQRDAAELEPAVGAGLQPRAQARQLARARRGPGRRAHALGPARRARRKIAAPSPRGSPRRRRATRSPPTPRPCARPPRSARRRRRGSPPPPARRSPSSPCRRGARRAVRVARS